MSVPANRIENQSGVNHTPGSNVVGINPDTPYNRIMSFINEYDKKSTRDSYQRYFRKMFSYMTGKQMEQITYQDIKAIDRQRAKEYRLFLKASYKASTINQQIFACKALWDSFKEDSILNINSFDLKPLRQEENNYGSLTYTEVQNLLDFCLTRSCKPMTQKLYFEFLFVVTCRKHVAQTLTWNQIRRELDVESKEMVWVVNFIGENADKAKDVKKPITEEFYNRLRENYESEGETNGKVFCRIDNATYDRTLKEFCKKYNIAPYRNIVQHSIKSSGLDFIQGAIGDINVTAEAANHSNIQTTYRNYLNKNKRFTSQPSYMLHKNFSIDMLKNLDKETLISLIQGAGQETIVKLCMELKKLTKQ